MVSLVYSLGAKKKSQTCKFEPFVLHFPASIPQNLEEIENKSLFCASFTKKSNLAGRRKPPEGSRSKLTDGCGACYPCREGRQTDGGTLYPGGEDRLGRGAARFLAACRAGPAGAGDAFFWQQHHLFRRGERHREIHPAGSHRGGLRFQPGRGDGQLPVFHL